MTSSRWTALLVVVSVSGCGDPSGRPPAWDPEVGGGPDAATTTEGEGDEDPLTTGDEPDTDGLACSPGQVQNCSCPDGLGQRECEADGSGFGPCQCDDPSGDSSGGGEPDDGTTTGEPDPDVVCYPGMANDWSTCLPLHRFDTMPNGYEYPPAYMGDPNYRPPVALIDLQEIDPSTWLAPNFQLVEIAQAEKGRYAIVQPHAIASIQALRDQVGGIGVNSGYRSPAYNASLDGSATYSRHMYGDGFDMDPLEVSLGTLENACTGAGGMLVEYTTHVHCDFRFDPVDEEFFGPAMGGAAIGPAFAATIEQDAQGVFTAPAQGFDEGEPQRRWTARDDDGEVIVTAVGPSFVPPAGTATVEVRVGAQLQRSRAAQ